MQLIELINSLKKLNNKEETYNVLLNFFQKQTDINFVLKTSKDIFVQKAIDENNVLYFIEEADKKKSALNIIVWPFKDNGLMFKLKSKKEAENLYILTYYIFRWVQLIFTKKQIHDDYKRENIFIFNRIYNGEFLIDYILNREFCRAIEDEDFLSIMLLKMKGKDILGEVAFEIENKVRGCDYVGIIGNNIIIIMPYTDNENVLSVQERILKHHKIKKQAILTIRQDFNDFLELNKKIREFI